MTTPAKFSNRQEVDFVIIGSGAAGGVFAKKLSEAGFSVVVLEQGPWRKPEDFRHDEWAYIYNNELTPGRVHGHPQTFRKKESEVARIMDEKSINPFWGPLKYAHTVGGSHSHFSGNYWRLRPVDFMEKTLLGPIAGSNFDDWPISYEELEPFYTQVDWEVGVSGIKGPSDPPRSRGYPCPPMPVKSPGVLLEKAGRKLGLNPYPAPVAILSQPHNERQACIHCGFCNGFACEVGAKSSSHIAMIPKAEATGNCEVRPLSTVFRIETNKQGKATEVLYYDQEGHEHGQKTKAVILSANGAETPRLLLLSESSQFPDGLANSSGQVGKNLMFNGWTYAAGLFDHPVNSFKSIPTTRVIHDYYSLDPKLGFYGGGGIDARSCSDGLPLSAADFFYPGGEKNWGHEFKQKLPKYFTHSAAFTGHTTSIPMESNNVSLDPTVKDKWGRPALRTTYKDHPDDVKTMQFFLEKCLELLDAAGATETWNLSTGEQSGSVHLLGTCRMGNDPAKSVVDKFNRAHDVPNLFICDGSSLVTSGRGQPTMTIQALAFRAAAYVIGLAKNGEI